MIDPRERTEIILGLTKNWEIVGSGRYKRMSNSEKRSME